MSPFNSTIWPILKPNENEWHFRQTTTISIQCYIQLRPYTKYYWNYFTAIGLARMFYSVPISSVSQAQFAFTFEGSQYTFTHLPTGNFQYLLTNNWRQKGQKTRCVCRQIMLLGLGKFYMCCICGHLTYSQMCPPKHLLAFSHFCNNFSNIALCLEVLELAQDSY